MSQTNTAQPALFGPCRRCGADTRIAGGTTSYFNTDWICVDCHALEQAHPAFPAAKAAEAAAVAAGDFNFAGVGCPPDLYLKGRA